MTHQLSKIIVVAGPTASGKSDFAVQIAHDLSRAGRGSEIISADSRQVYRGLDIGTGKITKEEMKGVPHHMLNVADVGDVFSVAEYVHLALPLLEDIIARGKTPIICGGTGQYIDALIFDTEIPAVEPNKELRERLEAKTTEELFTELTKKDSRRATSIDKNNRRRLIRALEIIETLGAVPENNSPHFKYNTKIYLMNPSRELVRKRIEKRLVARLDNGMLNECKKLLVQGVTHEQLERLGLEYRYISRYLQGIISYDEFVTQLKNKICQYAKRQDTWNKKYLPFAELIEVKE